MKLIINNLSKQLNLKNTQIESVLGLLADGSTVPFIARYRKEVTGNLDEDVIRLIEKEFKYQKNVETRKNEILRLIDEKGMLTDELKNEINKADKLQTLEDLYLPYKEKRKTKATEAIKNGLEPLSQKIVTSNFNKDELYNLASEFINESVPTIVDAISGAGHIISEQISDTARYREFIRKDMYQNGQLVSKLKRNGQEKDEKMKFEMYYDFSQSLKKLPHYRVLAFNRGEKEKVLNIKIEYNHDRSFEFIDSKETFNKSGYTKELYSIFINDALKRLILPSIEREIRAMINEKAEENAIKLFGENLEVLIMQPPVKGKTILSFDPAFRTGCKLAVIDKTGHLLHIDVVYPHAPVNKVKESNKIIDKILTKFNIDLIVCGNGTASRETESYVEEYLKINKLNIPFSIVSEAGASVYSASKVAQAEFPDLSVEKRSAVSIARRVQDPMAELVKIDPKSIGVGQYQHDVNQKKLAENLDFIMIKSINKVGIDVNTASVELLKYVSGLDRTIAKNIVEYRNENGPFQERKELKLVKRLGAKAFEQSAGFLKILDGKEQLDSTFIHPESYCVTNKILKELKIDKSKLGSEEVKQICETIDINSLATKYEITDILLLDIIKSIKLPVLDIRDNIKVAQFDKTVTKMEDLKIGMKIQGQVRNIVDFGAFVDVGLKNDALVHLSQISNTFVNQVSDYLKIGDVLTFTILNIDEQKGRIQLTLKEK